MNDANNLIDSQLKSIFSVHNSIGKIAEKNKMHPPLIFAGMAVYLCSQSANFRPGCDKLSGDIDYIIPAKDITTWQDNLEIQFTREESENFSGSVAKTQRRGIEIDMLADSQMHRKIPGGTISCNFIYEKQQVSTSSWENSEYFHTEPAQLLFFKLIMGRGIEQGKYDFEDACALILDANVNAAHFKSTIFSQNNFAEFRAEFISARLAQCCKINSSIVPFKEQFDKTW